MTSETANRRNRAQAAFRAYSARIGHATDHWFLLSEAEVEAWCCAADAALGLGFQPTAGFASNTCCAGTVMRAQVVMTTSEDWKGVAFAGIVGGSGGAGAAGAGVPFMVGGGGAGGVPATSGSGVFPTGIAPGSR